MSSTEIHPWEEYRSVLINELDANKLWFEHARNLSRKQLGGLHVKDASSFFLALENNFEENDLMDFFINLFSHMEFHVDFEKVADKIKQYKQKLHNAKRDCLSLGIWKDKNFVGREKEIEEIENFLQDEKIKGVSICGLGGMGKTSLANQICLKLHPHWSLTKIDLREQQTVRDLVRLTCVQLDMKESHDDEDEWNVDKETKYLINDICDLKRRRRVILFDNIDDVLVMDGEKTKVIKFLSDLLCSLDNAGSKCGVRVMITSRQTMLPLVCNNDILREVEVKQLEPETAEVLFDKCTSKVTYPTLPPDRAEIVRLCGYCPLAIRTICSTLRRNRIRTSELVVILKASPQGTEIMNMKSCLMQTFTRLSQYYQEKLLYLNLFTTAKFSVDDAVAVITEGSKVKETDKYATLLDLVYLKGQHLLEVSDDAFGTEDGSTGKYSVHPLVHQYLKEESENQVYSEGLQKAKERFIKHYNRMAIDMSNKSKISLKLMVGMVDEMTHLRKFYDYLKSSPDCLNVTGQKSEAKRVFSMSRIADLCSFLSPNHDRYELYDKFIMFNEDRGEVDDMVLWKTEKAKLLFEMGKLRESKDIIDDISRNVNLGNEEESGKKPIYANFRYMKGRIDNKLNEKEEAIKNLNQASSLYQQSVKYNPMYKTELANVYNTLGCVYYDKDMLEESEKYHRMALEETNGEDANTVNYYANLGTCCLALGHKSSKQSEKEKYFKDADRFYSASLGLGDRNDDRRARKLMNRSKLYCLPEMKKFETGWEDLTEAVEILERNLVPPHESLTLAYHEKGDFLMYLASHCCKVNNDKESAKRHYQEAERCYNQVMDELKRGGLYSTNKHYNRIKENHKTILKKLFKSEEWEKAEQFYADFESGRYERRRQKAGSVAETMEASRRLGLLGQKSLSQDMSSSSDDDQSSVISSPNHNENNSSSYESSAGESSMEEDTESLDRRQVDPHPEGKSRQDSGVGGSFTSVSSLRSTGDKMEPNPPGTLRLDSGVGQSLSSISTPHSTGSWREPRPVLTSMASGSMEEDVFSEDTPGGRKLTSLSSMSSIEEDKSSSFDTRDLKTFNEIMQSEAKRTKKLKRQNEIEENLVGTAKKMKE